MVSVRLIHWHQQEAEARAADLRSASFAVEAAAPRPAEFMAGLARDTPTAIAISLDRLPMQGRDAAFLIQQRKALRAVPLIFVGGAPDKVDRVRESFPHALYSSWDQLPGLLRKIASGSVRASAAEPRWGYASSPLARKLCIEPGMTIACFGPLPEAIAIVREQVEGLTIQNRADRGAGIALWFVKSRDELDTWMDARARKVPGKGLWIFWPKQRSGKRTDLTQHDVRAAANAAGLVDCKVCSLDATWSGFLFVPPRATRKRA